MLGEKIYSSQINEGKTEIDISEHLKGVYFIKLLRADNILTRKVIIQ